MKQVAINSSGGGSDSGATGNGIIEKELTLKISNIIKKKLEDKGVEVLMLRSGDETSSYDDRIAKLKETFPNANNVIVLSNTLNSGGGSGIEVIYPLNKRNTLASSINDNLEYFNDSRFFQYRWPTDTAKDYYYLTRNTPNYETIIVRYGYVDSSKDATIIKDNYEKMAEAVADAILDYIGIPEEGGYIVKAGDTLYAIASKFNTTVDEIKKLNNLTSNNLTIGKSLKIPTSTPSIEEPKENNVYTVKSGDTLYAIANKFGTTVDKLKEMNNLKSTALSIGQKLTVPSNQTSSNVYVVKAGDTLYSIAKKFNISVDELKKLNNKTNNAISVGEELNIGTPNTITIQSGDTLYSLAKKYNTTVDELKKLNNLKSNTLTVGKSLLIP